MFPQTEHAARIFANQLKMHLQNATQDIMVATIADVTNHLTHGYVLATYGTGRIQIYGVPYSTVVPGMRVYCRMLSQGKRRHYTFLAYAPTTAVGYTSGCLMVSSEPGATVPAQSITNITLPTTQSAGYFWSFFFYTPSLPTTTMCLFDWRDSTTNKGIQCLYLANGQLMLTTYGVSPVSRYTTTNAVVAPHQIWHVNWQLGPGSNWQPCTLNGYRNGYTTTTGTDIVWPTTGPYQINWLNSADGTQPCQIGTWVSKMQFGIDASGTAPLIPVRSVPRTDADIPHTTATVTTGFTSLALWLCGADVQSSSLHDTMSGHHVLALNSSAIIPSIGPY